MIRLSFASLLLPLCLASLVACGAEPEDTASSKDDTGTDDTATDDTGSDDTGGDTDTGEDTDTAVAEDIAVIGEWVDNWGSAHLVANDAWRSGDSEYAITQYDNDGGYAIAQNDAGNDWNPGMWSRFDWGWLDGELLYCQTAYDAASEADALATPAADISSPRSGCGGFSWSALRAPLSISDGWDDAWGGGHVIDAFGWHSEGADYAIYAADDAAGWLVAKNGAGNDWNPGLWSRFDWTWNADALYYCQTGYAEATEADALAKAAADSGNLSAGCGGFSWTELRAMLSINGEWADGWGGTHDINAFAWTSGSSRYDITQAHDEESWLVAQNADTNDWSPSLWSRFDWTWDGAGQLWFCQTAYAAATEADAVSTPAADPSDPANSGCGGFSWSSMDAAAL
jgi:hypothetical protein